MFEKNQTKSNRGGKRDGSGRKPGSANLKTREIANKAAIDGITPLEVMLEAMHQSRNEGDLAKAAQFARDAAPYIHPKLANIDSTVNHSGGIIVEITRYADTPSK